MFRKGEVEWRGRFVNSCHNVVKSKLKAEYKKCASVARFLSASLGRILSSERGFLFTCAVLLPAASWAPSVNR